MNSDDKKGRNNPSVEDYASPEFVAMPFVMPEKGFASSDVAASGPAKWEAGNEEWWND